MPISLTAATRGHHFIALKTCITMNITIKPIKNNMSTSGSFARLARCMQRIVYFIHILSLVLLLCAAAATLDQQCIFIYYQQNY